MNWIKITYFEKIIRKLFYSGNKEPLNIFINNINKNLEIVITTIKQFSNNFFKIGYFNPIGT